MTESSRKKRKGVGRRGHLLFYKKQQGGWNMKRKRVFFAIGVLGLMLSLSAFSFAGSEMPPKPAKIKWANYDIGGSPYVQGAAVAEAMLKKFGIKVRTLPLGNGIGRMMAVRTGTSDFFFSGGDVVYARKGIEDWAVREWGPQPLRTVWMVKRRSTFAMATRGDSGIKNLQDLKGRRIPYVVGSPSVNAAVEGALALVGLTWRDVVKVDFPSALPAYMSVKDGKTDAMALNSTAAWVYETEASPGGIYWIPYPRYEQNPEGWKKFAEIYPGTFPDLVTKGAGISPEKPVYTANFPFPNIFTYDRVDENLVYWQVKAIVELYDMYKNSTDDTADWALKKTLSLPIAYAPWHKGAVKYFKEIGVWTKEMEHAQNHLLALDQKSKDLWETTLEESVEKKVKGKDFRKFWLEKRNSAGLK
jgi:TRAP transporter TAXI family solute receptor